MDDTITYGAWVRRRRRDLDLTQAELAHRVSCALTTIEKLSGIHILKGGPGAWRLFAVALDAA